MRRCDYRGGKLGLVVHRKRFAPAASFGRSSNCIYAANGYLPTARLKLASSPCLPPTKALSRSPIMSGIRILLLPWSGACARFLRSACARVAEHFCQLLAPVVEISLLGDVTAVAGIGVRLMRDGRAIPHEDSMAARTRRLDRLHAVSDPALQFMIM